MMTDKNCVTSVDMGTGSVRSCLVDTSLSILYKSQFDVLLSTNMAGEAEQDPDEVVSKPIKSIRESLDWVEDALIKISAIYFSNAASSLGPLDESYKPRTQPFTYADTRAHGEAQSIKGKFPSIQFQIVPAQHTPVIGCSKFYG